jgi:hypothetical protein
MGEKKLYCALVKGGTRSVGSTCVGFSKTEQSVPILFVEPTTPTVLTVIFHYNWKSATNIVAPLPMLERHSFQNLQRSREFFTAFPIDK